MMFTMSKIVIKSPSTSIRTIFMGTNLQSRGESEKTQMYLCNCPLVNKRSYEGLHVLV